jgi:hypothetical protein
MTLNVAVPMTRSAIRWKLVRYVVESTNPAWEGVDVRVFSVVVVIAELLGLEG